jgi:hypothetical protein
MDSHTSPRSCGSTGPRTRSPCIADPDIGSQGRTCPQNLLRQGVLGRNHWRIDTRRGHIAAME